ncbi:MAG: extracellular solute-binding protein [Chloroflexales bacterium]|nr:extracellular solute-binding protein [Chloroflexales bacterium]
MKQGKFLFLAIITLLALVLSACGAQQTAGDSSAPATDATSADTTNGDSGTDQGAADEPGTDAGAADEEPSGEAVTITMWTKEGEADGGLQFSQALIDSFNAENPNITIEVVKKKDVEELREDFQTAALAGSSPDLLWTVNDHAGPFTAAELIQPVDDTFDLSLFVEGALEAVQLDDQTWGIPISSGNHLMLLYNKSLIESAPADTDALIASSSDLTTDDVNVLVFNQTEPFWMVPWLGGFGGQVFAEDGITPTLDTPEMVATLQFLRDIKFNNDLIPSEGDYDSSDTLFKEGKAAMIINGDWSLASYSEALGDDLGVASIPVVSATGEAAKPFTAGTYFMIPTGVEGGELDAVVSFINYITNIENQLKQMDELKRLPALKEALTDPSIEADPLLAGSVAQLEVGTGTPAVLEMRCIWDAMKPELQAVMADSKSPEDAAAAMQSSAEACIATLG